MPMRPAVQLFAESLMEILRLGRLQLAMAWVHLSHADHPPVAHVGAHNATREPTAGPLLQPAESGFTSRE